MPRIAIFSGCLLFFCPSPCGARHVGHEGGGDLAGAPVLRSAWMLGAPQYHWPTPPSSALDEQAQLGRHFVEVERILIRDMHASLREAVARLEDTLGFELGLDERESLYSLLHQRRWMQIARLRQYREAGRFPLNTDPHSPPRPIFVDEQGTLCAVGYLMWRSGAQADVRSIARENNFVVLPDVQEGPFIAWVLESGLLREEAALIQPAYGWQMQYVGHLSDFLQGGTTELDGLRYENFTFHSVQAGVAPVDPSQMQLIRDPSGMMGLRPFRLDPNPVQPVQDGAAPFELSQMQVTTDDQGMVRLTPFALDPGAVPLDWSTNFLALRGQLGTTTGAHSLLWRVGFDVVAISPSKRISAVYLTSYLTGAGKQSFDRIPLHGPDGTLLANPDLEENRFYDGYAEYRSALSADGTPLGSVSVGGSALEDFSPGDHRFLDVTRGLSFGPVQRMHVETQLLLAGEAYSFDIAHEFTVVNVPEPSGLSLVIALALSTALARAAQRVAFVRGPLVIRRRPC